MALILAAGTALIAAGVRQQRQELQITNPKGKISEDLIPKYLKNSITDYTVLDTHQQLADGRLVINMRKPNLTDYEKEPFIFKNAAFRHIFTRSFPELTLHTDSADGYLFPPQPNVNKYRQTKIDDNYVMPVPVIHWQSTQPLLSDGTFFSM